MSVLEQLPGIARQTVTAELRGTSAPEPDRFPDDLMQVMASFVTLTLQGQLRGCIGSLEGRDPLGVDVMANARRAAFQDPRFPPLQESELDDVRFEVSVLSSPEPFPVEDEADLLNRLQPGRDGLILRDGRHRSTFLPAVWEEISDTRSFLMHLKRKAGLPTDYWSGTIHFERYTATKFSE